MSIVLCDFPYAENEVPAAAAEVPGISGGWKSVRSPAGPPSWADASQIQHREDPQPEWVCSPAQTYFALSAHFSYIRFEII